MSSLPVSKKIKKLFRAGYIQYSICPPPRLRFYKLFKTMESRREPKASALPVRSDEMKEIVGGDTYPRELEKQKCSQVFVLPPPED